MGDARGSQHHREDPDASRRAPVPQVNGGEEPERGVTADADWRKLISYLTSIKEGLNKKEDNYPCHSLARDMERAKRLVDGLWQ